MSIGHATFTTGAVMRTRLAALAATLLTLAFTGLASAQTPVVARIDVMAGRSTVVTTEFDVNRIAITNPAIADAVVVAPREVLVDGKSAGTVSLIVWGGSGANRLQFDVVVEPPSSALQQLLRSQFPGESITVTTTEESLTLSGGVSSNDVMLKAGQIATKAAPKLTLINLLQTPSGLGSQQVMLQVRFAEVNRQALRESGVSFFTGALGSRDWVGRTSTQQFSAPSFEDDKLTFSDFLNIFLFNTKENIGGVLKALETKGLLQTLAEPNLIAYNGKEASFLAGGEVPVPVVQGGSGGSGSVSVVYKEFGVRLAFTPTIAGDMIRLNIKPEVSTLDFANGVTLSGFRIPALSTRKADTEVELRDGQSFAIAGLMNNIAQTDRSAIPILGNLPIIGALFKSRALRQQKTELMVLVTPHLVRPLNPDEVPTLPTSADEFLQDDASALLNRVRGGTAAAAKKSN